MQSGEKEKLLVVDAISLKILKTFEYEGNIQEMFTSANLDKIIFSTTAVENEKVYIYTFIAAASNYSLKPVVGYALKMPTIIVAFNAQASEAYITDGSLAEQAFASPFSTVGAYGRKIRCLSQLPFPGLSNTPTPTTIGLKSKTVNCCVVFRSKKSNTIWWWPTPYRTTAKWKKLMEKGRDIDLTSSEEVKIFFGANPDYFIIYFSDLKNAFQGLVYDRESNKATKFDETMFLGEKYYSELDIVNFNPEKNEILFMTKDKEKNLYLFNYHSLLYKKLGNGILAVCVNRDIRFHLFSKRKKQVFIFQ